MKKVLIAVVVLIVVIAGALFYLGSNLDSIVKAGVEKYGPRFTGTEVRLASVESSLMGGEVTINELFLGNPSPFKTPHAFRVQRVHVAVDPETVMSDVVRVREIVIEAPDIIYELGQGGSNLQTIQKNVAQAAGAGKPPAGDAKPAEPAEAGKKVVIENLYVRNAKAALSAGVLGGKVVPVPVPDLHLTGIGEKTNGATIAEASRQVMDAITNSVVNAAKQIDLKGLSGEAQKMLEDAGKGAQEQMKGMEDKLKGLFGK